MNTKNFNYLSPCERKAHPWDEQSNFSSDVEYLQELYQRILGECVAGLNEFHGLSIPKRDWEILLGCWLSCFLGAAIDRWRNRFDLDLEGDGGVFSFFKPGSRVPIDTDSSLEHFRSDNFDVFSFGQVSSLRLTPTLNTERGSETIWLSPSDMILKTRQLVGLLRRRWDLWRLKLSSASAFFADSYFKSIHVNEISARVGVVAVVPSSLFSIQSEAFGITRCGKSLKIVVQARNGFEFALARSITSLLPQSMVERFKGFDDLVAGYPLAKRLLMTANYHLWNDIFNFWALKHRQSGIKVLACQHGGCFPKTGNMLNFPESAFDQSLVWHRAIHPNQLRVPSQLFFDAVGDMRRCKEQCNDLLLLPFDPLFLPQRAQRCPFRDSVWTELDQKIEFLAVFQNYDPDVGNIRVRARPSINGYLNVGNLLLDYCSKAQCDRDLRLVESATSARVVVCGYPQTGFAELLVANIPTILLLVDTCWDIEESFELILNRMIEANIAFTSGADAAYYLATNWNKIDSWWFSEEVQVIRRLVLDDCLSTPADGLEGWVKVLNSIGVEAV